MFLIIIFSFFFFDWSFAVCVAASAASCLLLIFYFHSFRAYCFVGVSVCAHMCVYVLCFRTLYQLKRAQLLGVLFFFIVFLLHFTAHSLSHMHTFTYTAEKDTSTHGHTGTLAHTHIHWCAYAAVSLSAFFLIRQQFCAYCFFSIYHTSFSF